MNLNEIEKLVELLERINSITASGTPLGRSYNVDYLAEEVAKTLTAAVSVLKTAPDEDALPF